MVTALFNELSHSIVWSLLTTLSLMAARKRFSLFNNVHVLLLLLLHCCYSNELRLHKNLWTKSIWEREDRHLQISAVIPKKVVPFAPCPFVRTTLTRKFHEFSFIQSPELLFDDLVITQQCCIVFELNGSDTHRRKLSKSPPMPVIYQIISGYPENRFIA